MTIKFGTDGWRAIIGKEFTFENVARVAHAYAEFLKSSGVALSTPIPIGFDRRFLSQDFANAFASVLASHHIPVQVAETYCPTPCISWTTKTQKAPGGVMITASHNPFQWNGVKFKESYGGSASPEMTTQIERLVANVNLPATLPDSKIATFNPRKNYIQALRKQINLTKIKKAKWKIAYDPLFGAGAGYLAEVLGLPVHEIHGEANTSFGGLNPEPIDKNLNELMTLVRTKKYDVGLATDGDADRIGAVDEKGRFVNSHQIFALILNHLIEKGLKGDVIKTVSTTRMIDAIAKKHGIKVHETPIGFKHICNKFLEITPLIGGEESGGIGIPSHVYERDGLLCGLLLLEIMSVKKKRLGALLKDLEKEIGAFHFERSDCHFPAEGLDRIRETITQANPTQLAGQKIVHINRLDGTKFVLADDSWLLLRMSGTEPLVRLYAEASNPTKVKKLIAEAKKLIL